jgi:hypothetical protein
MKRTTIMLPEDVKARAERRAKRLGISLAQLIRNSLELLLGDRVPGPGEDPFFADTAVYAGRAPKDLAASHDRFLYGDDR